MKIVRYGIFFCSATVVFAIVVCRPSWLVDNKFIDEFVGPELLSLLVVILTITFASVANIHLSLHRFTVSASKERRESIRDIRTEINYNAWLIFSAFVICVISLFVKGTVGDNLVGEAVTNGVCLLVLLLNVLVMHDLYHAIFALVSTDTPQSIKSKKDDQLDFT